MKTKKALTDFCLTLPGTYEDHPFRDGDWTVVRRRETLRGFAWIFPREGRIWVNIKLPPEKAVDLREAYPSARPAYHMNKTHWTSLILDGSIPDRLIKDLITDSYSLCGVKAPKGERNQK